MTEKSSLATLIERLREYAAYQIERDHARNNGPLRDRQRVDAVRSIVELSVLLDQAERVDAGNGLASAVQLAELNMSVHAVKDLLRRVVAEEGSAKDMPTPFAEVHGSDEVFRGAVSWVGRALRVQHVELGSDNKVQLRWVDVYDVRLIVWRTAEWHQALVAKMELENLRGDT